MTTTFDMTVVFVIRALLDAAWQASIAGLVLFAIERLMRRAPSRWRSALLTVAVLRFAWPAALGLPVGLPGLPSLLAPGSPTMASAAAWSWLAVVIVFAWALGFLVRAAGLVAGKARLARQLVFLSTDASEARRVRALARRIGLERVPALALLPGAGTPFVFDTHGPVLVLPEWRIEPGEARLALLHELAHLKRGDLVVRQVAAWIGALWWWNPVVALLVRRLHEVQEEACDDLAIATAGAPPERYGRMIVREARAWQLAVAAGSIPARAVAGLGGASLEHRLRRLLDPRDRATRLSPAHGLLLVLAAVVLLPRAASPAWQVLHAPAYGSRHAAQSLDPALADEHHAAHRDAHRRAHLHSH